jgi:hypothetical protein
MYENSQRSERANSGKCGKWRITTHFRKKINKIYSKKTNLKNTTTSHDRVKNDGEGHCETFQWEQ